MLCKRFKECTRRKWPYRYLRKIDKIISMLELQKKEGMPIPNEDEAKLKKLTQERIECLKPVRIRITTYDKMLSPSVTTTIQDSPNAESSADDESSEEHCDSDVVETLQNLKSLQPKPQIT